MISVIRSKIEEEVVFVIALSAALITSIFASPRVEAINFKVLLSLFDLMLMSLAFEKYNLLDYIATSILNKVKSERGIGFVMILTTAILGMLITNDVALITVVPITISMSRKAKFNPFRIIVFETLAANIGSSLTPFGNPQNLYLYSFYNIPTLDFIGTIAPFVILGMLFLLLLNLRHNKQTMDFHNNEVKLGSKPKLSLYLLLFVCVVASILGLIPYWLMTGIVILVLLIWDLDLFPKVDYFLLGTFVCFFIFVDNMNRMPWINDLAEAVLGNNLAVFGYSALLSQGISNVPSAVLISGFTSHYREVLIGVSVGGMGTLIASLANLISYKFYIKEYPVKPYKQYFYRMNVLGFIVIGLAMAAWITALSVF